MTHDPHADDDDAPTEAATSPLGDGAHYSVGALAELADVSRRAVRYYVHEGLLPGPHGLGRGAYYTDQHLALLVRLRDLQAQGLGLAAVRQRLASDAGPTPALTATDLPIASSRPSPATWLHVDIRDGVVLQLRADAYAYLTADVLDDITSQITTLFRSHIQPTHPPHT